MVIDAACPNLQGVRDFGPTKRLEIAASGVTEACSASLQYFMMRPLLQVPIPPPPPPMSDIHNYVNGNVILRQGKC